MNIHNDIIFYRRAFLCMAIISTSTLDIYTVHAHPVHTHAAKL